MSSLFTASEIALARLGLAPLRDDGALDVVVGGLGLGYTAQAVLKHSAVRSLVVVEMLEAVIDWHREGLLPLGPELTADPRCRFVGGGFLRDDGLGVRLRRRTAWPALRRDPGRHRSFAPRRCSR